MIELKDMLRCILEWCGFWIALKGICGAIANATETKDFSIVESLGGIIIVVFASWALR